MQPFETLSEAIRWWRINAVHRNVCLLVDNTSIGLGIQKREAQWNSRDGWVMGFPSNAANFEYHPSKVQY
jgi:hypothetical protein